MHYNARQILLQKNEEFVALTGQILDAAIEHKPKTLEQLLSLELSNGTVSQLITDKIGATGEKWSWVIMNILLLHM